jgi:rhomboid protease GluP
MAIGFTPNYTLDISLDGLTQPEFLAICVTTARALDWDVRYISDAGLIALTGKSMFKANQKVTIYIADDLATIKSESTGSEMMDLGRNKKNVEKFTTTLSEGIGTSTPEQLAQTYDELRPALVSPDQDILTRPPATTKERWGSFFSLFVPREGYFITGASLPVASFISVYSMCCSICMPSSTSAFCSNQS